MGNQFSFPRVLVLIAILLVSHVNAVSTVVLIGRTGDGKSASGNLMARVLEYPGDQNLFSESAGADSHTMLPKGFTVDGFRVIDTPGLMDNRGTASDEQNVVEIVKHLAAEGTVNAFILVVNEEAPRFDGPMQEAVKLLYDTFGPVMISQMGILFTRSTKQRKEESVKYVSEHFVPALKLKLGLDVVHIPSWQVENHPESLRGGMLGASDEAVQRFHARNKESIQQLKNWASAKPAIDVTQVIPSTYEATQKREAAENETKEALLAKREADRRAEEAAEVYRREQTEATRQIAELERRNAQLQAQRVRDGQTGAGFWDAFIAAIPVMMML